MVTSTLQANLLSLPSEILLQIIASIVPVLEPTPIAFSQTHATTKALLSLTQTCKTTYPAALLHLYTHCLYIDSPSRLQRVVETLSSVSTETKHRLLQQLSSLYLAPFTENTIHDPTTVSRISRLLTFLSPVLRRLVIDMPLRGYTDELEVALVASRKTLRGAFELLTQLEVFCSVRDELYLSSIDRNVPDWRDLEIREADVFTFWPKLRTLALYNVDILFEPRLMAPGSFWREVVDLRDLENLILTRCDGLDEIRFEDMWKECERNKNRDKKLDVVIANVEGEHRLHFPQGHLKIDKALSIRQVNVPIGYYGDEDPIELCQEFIKRRMLNGVEIIQD